eukprot:2511284-Prymnesium_polylepis.1
MGRGMGRGVDAHRRHETVGTNRQHETVGMKPSARNRPWSAGGRSLGAVAARLRTGQESGRTQVRGKRL